MCNVAQIEPTLSGKVGVCVLIAELSQGGVIVTWIDSDFYQKWKGDFRKVRVSLCFFHCVQLVQGAEDDVCDECNGAHHKQHFSQHVFTKVFHRPTVHLLLDHAGVGWCISQSTQDLSNTWSQKGARFSEWLRSCLIPTKRKKIFFKRTFYKKKLYKLFKT